ncbi:MAG: TetR/AcrR family transcriptional regulator [Actinomycetota bacterium]|nr:TetR/AcrR family transcriptional regulator [Actinomycetota bacterium]
MPRLANEAREERRVRFIEAARRCSATKGYRSLTIDAVCAEAGGLSKGAFYTYFRSKQDLLVALLEDDAARLEALIATLSDAPLSELERSQRFLREVLKLGEDSAEVQRRADLWSEMLADESIRERLGAVVARRRKLLAGWIEAGTRSGELVDIPANAFAAILVALSDGLILHRALDPSGFRWGNIRLALDTIFDALRSHPPS